MCLGGFLWPLLAAGPSYAFHCIYATKDCNPRQGDYAESAEPRSRVGVTAPPEQTPGDWAMAWAIDRIPQFPRTIQLGDQAIDRVVDRVIDPIVDLHFRSAGAGTCEASLSGRRHGAA